VFFGHVNLYSTIFTPMLTTSYQRSYGNIYAATSDVFEAAYAPRSKGCLPSTAPINDLFATGKLPLTELLQQQYARERR